MAVGLEIVEGVEFSCHVPFHVEVADPFVVELLHFDHVRSFKHSVVFHTEAFWQDEELEEFELSLRVDLTEVGFKELRHIFVLVLVHVLQRVFHNSLKYVQGIFG